jgi:hypothetical protein
MIDPAAIAVVIRCAPRPVGVASARQYRHKPINTTPSEIRVLADAGRFDVCTEDQNERRDQKLGTSDTENAADQPDADPDSGSAQKCAAELAGSKSPA